MTATKYRELTGLAAFSYAKDPALLSWVWDGQLALQVFPCFANQEKTVEYTLTLPTMWTNGQSVLRLPALGTDAAVPKVVIQSDLGPVFVDGEQSTQTDLSKAVESTWREIVEVTVVADGHDANTRQSCMDKAVWDAVLPEGFGAFSQLSTAVGPM